MSTIGYVVPEFPGQTHIFFWREILRLEQMGLSIDIVSTRRPPTGIRSHVWSDEAETRTIYLQNGGVAATAADLLRSIPKFSVTQWISCARSVLRAKVTIAEKLKLLIYVGFGARLGVLARSRGWQHIHVHSCANAANVACFSSLLSNVPYSLTLHGPLSDYGPNQLEKWGNARFGITITKKLLAEVERQLGPAIAAKTVVVPMGVNLHAFVRPTRYRPWNGTGAARLYSVGRLNPCKGHDHLIHAVAILKDRGLNVQLTIAGQDEQGGEGYFRTLSDLIAELDLTESVKLAGALSEAAVRDGLLESHIFALASLHEPLGVAIMEAMALEMPVVATSGGGVPELIDHEQDGYLVPPEDPEALAVAIEKILRDQSLAERLAASSRQKIERGFQDTNSAEVLALHAR